MTPLPPEWVVALQGGVGAAYALAALLALARRAPRTVVGLAAGALAVHAALIVWRGFAQGQAPMVTRYEDFTLDALFLSVGYLAARRWRPALHRAAAPMLLAAAALAAAALTYSQNAYPWSPALRIFWLQVHAPLNSLALALATLCASLALVGGRAQAALCTRLLWWVTLLWSAMVMAGAYWASLAWGRFWGWDPIESWSLATALAYAAAAHLALRGGSSVNACRLALPAYAMMLFTTYGLLLVRRSIHGQYLFQ